MAVKIVLKRSSIPNKRPNADLLSPGELALNTNALTPGLFFETENNAVVKVGPTSVGTNFPTLFPSLGETFFNTATRALSVGTISEENASAIWTDIASPFLGGTEGYVVFVAPEFPSSSDDVTNDGQAAPFKTINRAVIEIAKISISSLNESDAGRNNRYTIMVAPGITPVYNGPGNLVTSDPDVANPFSVNFEGDTPSIPSPLTLQQFNPVSGGLPIPRGTSIIGMDLRKVQIRPSYVPTYKNPTTGEGVNQPRSAILKWTGNSLQDSYTFRDKRTEITVQTIKTGPAGEGEFVSARPHCFGYNDKVYFEWVPQADQRAVGPQSSSIVAGFYYVYPTGVNTFYLSFSPLDLEPNYVERVQLPAVPQEVGYLATCTWEGRSHNRLTALYPATTVELDEFYKKVQLAYPVYFQGKSNQAEVVNPGETEIVARVPLAKSESLLADSTDNASPYAHNISLRSNYGMCGMEQDGKLVTGFRSALAGQVTTCSLQNDPVAYDVYTTIQDPVTLNSLTGWYTLQYATWASIPSGLRPSGPSQVTREQQMEFLNNTDVVNIRYHYELAVNSEGKSFGYANTETDFRHFAFRASNGAFMQIDSGWTIGTAVGYWALNGGNLTVTNSSTNFGLNALRSEGFLGLGNDTSGSLAYPSDSGFSFSGIRLPEKITSEDTTNATVLELGPNIISVVNRPNGLQEITLGKGFLPINILPFSLAPATGIYSRIGGLTYRAFFVNDGLPTVRILQTGEAVLRVRSADSTYPLGSLETLPSMKNWSPPFIRRWKDPRNIADSSYALILNNTNPDHRSPEAGNILRLNQNSSSSSLLLRPGVQFDPGSSGGWGRIFKVAYSEVSYRGDSPQLNEVLINRNQGSDYYVGFMLCDAAKPWQETKDTAHGNYITYDQRNWYAAANDQWRGVYFNTKLDPVTSEKLPPADFNSPYAVSMSSEVQGLVKDTYQGAFAPDPDQDVYEDGYYFRGSQPAYDNYGFELYYNGDNGTNNFGLLRHNVMTSQTYTPVGDITPGQTVITVTSVEEIPSPNRYFVVMAITDPAEPNRKEYVQVIKVSEADKELTVIRGVYDTPQDSDWGSGSVLALQGQSTEVLPQDYDFDWSLSKQAILRFFAVMGYTKEQLSTFLVPRERSFRNIGLEALTIRPSNGYAVATGAWPLSFTASSQVDAFSHSFHSVGRLSYSRGLPRYLGNEFAVKQYYDYLNTSVFGGVSTVTGGDEYGNLPQSGENTQITTGRPAGTFTSEVTDFTRVNPGDAGGDEGGGGGEAGVTAVYTGEGLIGGPIFREGVISLVPPLGQEIGGVKQGNGIVIATDGTISVAQDSGTVQSITFGNGLTGGTITVTGTVGINTGTGLFVNSSNQLTLNAGSATEIGGVKTGTGVSISPEGALSILPPTANVIGGVKAGSGINIDANGIISATGGGGSSTIRLLDQFNFDGTQTQFTISVGGTPVVPTAAQYVLIVVGGIIQGTPTNYTTANSILTFSSPPPADASFYGLLFG